MSTPNEPQDPQQPTDSIPPAPPAWTPEDAQPTQTFSDAQPTQAYPPAQPTEAYPPAAPAYGQPPAGAYGQQPGYGQQPPAYAGQPLPYGQPPQPGAPAGPDTRPKRLGWIALGLGVAAAVLTIISFATSFLLAVGFIAAVLAILVGLAALILGIMVLVKKSEGNKVGGIVAIVGGVIAGLAWIPFVLGLALFGLAAAGNSGATAAPEPSASASESGSASEEPSEEPTEASGSYDPDAYVAQVRPQINELMGEVDPSFTPETVEMIYSDDALISFGEGFASLGSLEAMQTARDPFVTSLASTEVMDEEQANRFFDIITEGAAAYLIQ